MKSHIAKGVVLLAVALSVARVSYRMGVMNGSQKAAVERISFDLCIYMLMYEMSSHIFSLEQGWPKPAWSTNNVKVLLSGTIDLYDSIDSADKEAMGGNPYFQRDVEKARDIVEGAEFVDLFDAVEGELKEMGINGEQTIRILER